jgi:hypothetical protein
VLAAAAPRHDVHLHDALDNGRNLPFEEHLAAAVEALRRVALA